MVTAINQQDIATGLMGTLQEVETAAQGLRAAMLTRNTDQIWTAVARQENSMSHLSRALEDYEATGKGAVDENAWGENGLRTRLVATGDKIRAMLRANRIMANTFIDLIDKTIGQVAAQVGGAPNVYDATGRMSRTTSSILIQDRG